VAEPQRAVGERPPLSELGKFDAEEKICGSLRNKSLERANREAETTTLGRPPHDRPALTAS